MILSTLIEIRETFDRLISEDRWSVIGIGLVDFQTMSNDFGTEWFEQVSSLALETLLSNASSTHSHVKQIARLTSSTIIVISSINKPDLFLKNVHESFEEKVFSGQIIHDRIKKEIEGASGKSFVLPSLEIGIVTSLDGPFSSSKQLFDLISRRRIQNQYVNVHKTYNELKSEKFALEDKLEVQYYDPSLLKKILTFENLSKPFLHDLRNSLSVLSELIRETVIQNDFELNQHISKSKQLLESCSEIRFRTITSPQPILLFQFINRIHRQFALNLKIDLAKDNFFQIYIDSAHLELAFFNLLFWLKVQVGADSLIRYTCVEKDNLIAVKLICHKKLLENTNITRRALIELEEGKPFLYLALSILRHNQSTLSINGKTVQINFQRYQDQDLKRTNILRNECTALKEEIYTLSKKKTFDKFKQPSPITETMRPCMLLLNDLSTTLEKINKRIKFLDPTESESLSLLRGMGFFCSIQSENFRTLGVIEPLQVKPIQLGTILERVVKIYKTRINSNISLEINLKENLPKALINEIAFSQIIVNFIQIAISDLGKYRPKSPYIRLATKKTSDFELQFSIKYNSRSNQNFNITNDSDFTNVNLKAGNPHSMLVIKKLTQLMSLNPKFELIDRNLTVYSINIPISN